MENTVPLCDLQPGQRGQIHSLCHPTLGRRLEDMGLTAERWVTCVGRSPGGDPAAYEICGAVIAIRRADAACVRVCPEGCDRNGDG